jgi:xanthine dehydrogenase accessory factor
MTRRVAERAAQLQEARVPFVHATVVRAQVPTSAHAGDDAIVLADGTIEGFVGGGCARDPVRATACDVLRTGEPVLLRVLPDGAPEFPDAPGAAVVVNHCFSGGALEIFLRPVVPPVLVEVVGDTPVAEAVTELAGFLGWTAARVAAGAVSAGASVVVVAGQGDGDHDAVRTALAAGVGYVALVASKRRGAAVLDELDLAPAERVRVRTPAGLAIGARTAQEVALAILAEAVAVVRASNSAPRR